MLLSRGVLPDSNTGANWGVLGPKKYGVSSDPNPKCCDLRNLTACTFDCV
ncbi:MAG: hypothetical protein QOF94_33 [Acidobacteriaceae bacterium]|jgi:hypothetical protein